MSAHPAPIPLTVIGGYLGAGKTTLLNHLLRATENRRIAVVVNDFGALNIDADLIEGQSETQINLTNGCICCGMSDGFDAALEELLGVRLRLDQIVVEASGVADVGVLARYAYLPGLAPDGVIVLADGERIREQAADRFVGRTVQRQLAAADLLILNKMDLLEPAARAELLDWIGGLALDARVLTAKFGRVPVELLSGGPVRALPAESEAHEHDAEYVSWAFSSEAKVSGEAAEAFLTRLPGGVLRAKGVINVEHGPRLLQVVGQRRTLVPWANAASTRLVAVGLRGQLNVGELDRLARLHL